MKSRLRILSGSILACLGLALLVSCAGDGPDEPAAGSDGSEPNPEPGATIDFPSQVQPFFDDHCACHLTVNPPEGLVLRAGASYDSLVGVASNESPNLLRVDPGNPDDSYLMIKIDDSLPNAFARRVGDRMPPEPPPVEAARIDIVRQWILEGAQRQGAGDDSDTQPPGFAGVTRAEAVSSAEIDLFWAQATDNVSPPSDIVYRVYFSTTSGGQDFTQPARIAPAGSDALRVGGLESATDHFFVVRAEDGAGNEDGNQVEQGARTLDTPGTLPPVPDPFPTNPLVERVCSQCHGLRVRLPDGSVGEITPPGLGVTFFEPGVFLTARPRSAALWESTVARMRNGNGAEMTDDEEGQIVAFFQENYANDS